MIFLCILLIGDIMFKTGDLVSRISHNNDVVFKIEKIVDDTAYLSGVNVRLCADSDIKDLVLVDNAPNDEDFYRKIDELRNFERSDYFYIPGKILHIDTDNQVSNNPTNPYFIRKNDNFKVYKKSLKKQKNGNFSKMYCTQNRGQTYH